MIRTGVFDYEDALTQSVGLTLFNCFTDDLVHLISDNSADILLRKIHYHVVQRRADHSMCARLIQELRSDH